MQKEGSVMNIDARVKVALDVFGDPVGKSVLDTAFKEHPARYYTFVCDSFGDDWGDDTPGCERCSVSIHFFAPLNENCIQRIRATKQALFAAGFTWPRVVDATDQNGQHYVLECEGIQEVEVE